jgi:ribosomal protein S18 acetylase RimI-like enzyme
VKVERITESSPELMDAMRRLIPQLSTTASPPDEAEIMRMLAAEGTFLLVALMDAGTIIGMLTLVAFRIPTGVRAWIEDVVVDEQARGTGIGSALVSKALAIARAEGARTVDLTSRPDRAAANRLYERLGFARRETNLYRYDLGAPDR